MIIIWIASLFAAFLLGVLLMALMAMSGRASRFEESSEFTNFWGAE